MSFNEIEIHFKKQLFVYLFLIHVFQSTQVYGKCRRFDGSALGHIDFNKISGAWNIHYTSDPLVDTNCSKVSYDSRDGDSVPFHIIHNSNQNSRGIINNFEDKRKQLTIDGLSYSYWILSTDYDNYILTYQCAKVPSYIGRPDSKEIYRILSRNCVKTSNLDRITNILKTISTSIQISRLSQPECDGSQGCAHCGSGDNGQRWDPLVNRPQPTAPTPIEYSNNIQPIERRQDITVPSGLSHSRPFKPMIYEKHEFQQKQSQSQHSRSERMYLAPDGTPSDALPPYGLPPYGQHPLIPPLSQSQSQSSHPFLTFGPSQQHRPQDSSHVIPVPPLMHMTPAYGQGHIQDTSQPPPLLSTPGGSDLSKKRCRKFETQSVKNIDIKSLSGHWNELFTSVGSDQRCTQLSISTIDDNSVHFKGFDCDNEYNGVLKRSAPADNSSKLILTINTLSLSFWVLDIGINEDILFIYQCSKIDPNGLQQSMEKYSIYSRQHNIPVPEMTAITNLMNRITKNIVLNPVSHHNCRCNEKQIQEQLPAQNKHGVPQPGEHSEEQSQPEDNSSTDGKLYEIPSEPPGHLNIAHMPAVNNSYHLNGCPRIPHVNPEELDVKTFYGIWHKIYSTDETNCISFEFEKSQQMKRKRYFIKRRGSDLFGSGFIRFEDNGQLTVNSVKDHRLKVWVLNVVSNSRLILYKCLADKTIDVNVLSRTKTLDPALKDLATDIIKRSGFSVNLIPIEQLSPNCNTGDGSDSELVCEDMSQKAMKLVDLTQMTGTWYSALVNVPGVRCRKFKHNEVEMSDPSMKGELWFDVINEKGTEGFGRIKPRENGDMTKMDLLLDGQKYISFLDMDYTSHMIYYQCIVNTFNGTSNRFLQYGMLTRTQTPSAEALDKAAQVFDDLELTQPFKVEQNSCQYISVNNAKNDNHCQKADKYATKKINLHKLKGKWYDLYSNIDNRDDASLEFTLNHNQSSIYTHIAKSIYYNTVKTAYIRLDPISGSVMAVSDELQTFGEFQLFFFEVNYKGQMITYQCYEFDGSQTRTVKLSVLSRDCHLDDPIKQKANQLDTDLKLVNRLTPITHYKCLPNQTYQTRFLSENCRHIENSDTMRLNLTKMTGRWDAELSNDELPLGYHVFWDTTNRFYDSSGKICYSKLRNSSNNIENVCEMDGQMTTGNFLPVSVDYNKYFMAYKCYQYEEKGVLTTKEMLNFYWRPIYSMSSEVNKNLVSDVFKQIPQKPLTQITDLLKQLKYVRNNDSIGQSIVDAIAEKTKCYRIEDQLYQIPIFAQKCRLYHEMNAMEVDFHKMDGPWNLDMVTMVMDVHIIHYIWESKNELNAHAVGLKCIINHRKGMKILDYNCQLNDRLLHFGNLYVVSVDYDKYILFYMCYQTEMGEAGEKLLLFLRPTLSSEADKNHNIFTNILATIPEKSIINIKDLIQQLALNRNKTSNNNDLKVDISPVMQRVESFQGYHLLTNKGNNEIFNHLNKMCTNFDEEELTFSDISSMTHNWTVDYASHSKNMETIADKILPFDRILTKQISNNTYMISLYNRETFLTESTLYYDINSKMFWTFTELSRRIRTTYLISNSDYAIIHVCNELNISGHMTYGENLYLTTSEHMRKPGDWFTYIELMVTHLQPKTWHKLSSLIERLTPVLTDCYDKNLTINSMKTIVDKYLVPKLQFEALIHKNRPLSQRPNREVFTQLMQNCKHFDMEELFDPDITRLAGVWRGDWTNFVHKSSTNGSNFIDIALRGNNIEFADYIPDQINHKTHSVRKVNGILIKYNNFIVGNIEGRRHRLAVLWTDYHSYAIIYLCRENEFDNQIAGNEFLILYSRIHTKARNLNTYMNLMANNLGPKTLAKIYQSITRLIPFDDNIINDEMKSMMNKISDNRAMSDDVVSDRLTFAEELYYKFISKGAAVKPVTKVLNGKEFSDRSNDEVFITLAKVCHHFDDTELVDLRHNEEFTGPWTIDWSTQTPFHNRYDSMIVERKGGEEIRINYYLNNELVTTIQDIRIHDSKWSESISSSGQRGIAATLFFDGKNAIIYRCSENEVNGQLTGKEVLRFLSNTAITDKTDIKTLDVYLHKLRFNAHPITLSKIIDLIANVRPIDCDVLNVDCQRSRHFKLEKANNAKSFATNEILSKNCLHFNQREIFEPDFRRMPTVWKIHFANYIDENNPFDTIQLSSLGVNRINIKLSLGSQVLTEGTERQLEDSNYSEVIIDGKRTIKAILYTDYADNAIAYTCRENFNDNGLGVFENLFFVCRINSKRCLDLNSFNALIKSKLSSNTSAMIEEFLPHMKPVYNKGMVGIDEQNPIYMLNRTEDSCPDLELFAQKDIDFSRLSGRWEAIYTSNNRWDRDCISTFDTYINSSDSLLQEKITNNKTHKVVIRHSKDSRSRQDVFVDKTLFKSWILETDYKSYRLAYTCYMKEVDGKRRRIDLQRLYTRNIESKDFDKQLLQRLRRKSTQIGKTLETINRNNCYNQPKYGPQHQHLHQHQG